jgi:LAO/AO transport system kinase
VENREHDYRDLLALLHPDTGRAFRVGVTGPPGAGKSTLVDGLAALWAGAGARVGVIAVDPTSPFTGGALLGDRVRMGGLSAHPGVYIRSMATRGSTGGVAAATGDVARVLDAFGFDWLLVETVGVGQIEIEIMNICDSVAVVFVPESGDGIQTLKAGLIEIAQLFVVNKADRPGADQLVTELEHVMAERRNSHAWSYPVLTTEAIHRKGIDRLAAELDRHRMFMQSDNRLAERRCQQALAGLENVLRERLHDYLREEPATDRWLATLSQQIATGEVDVHHAAGLIWQRLRGAEPGSAQEE